MGIFTRHSQKAHAAQGSWRGTGSHPLPPYPQVCTSARALALDADVELDPGSWRDVYSACLGPSRLVQLACQKHVVGGRAWDVDFDAGTLFFEDDAYPVQFLGSESSTDGSWLWGWDNVNNFPDELLTTCHHVHALGLSWGVAELTTARLALTPQVDGHALAAVASVLSPEPVAYYRGPHVGGAVLMAFSGLPEKVFAPVGVSEAAEVVTQCLDDECDHRILVEGLLRWNGTAYTRQGRRLTAYFPQDLVFDFDAGMRLEGMSVQAVA